MTTIQTTFERFCATMPHITKLILSYADYEDGVLRAIAANMHHLKYLDISYCTIEPKGIEYLLPTEDNALGGCPELVVFDMVGNLAIDVKLLQKIILALPKLRSLKHELLINALGNLTEDELDVDTARYLNNLYASSYQMSNGSCSLIRYHILVKSPAFQRLKNSITTVNIDVLSAEEQPVESALADILMCLPKLKMLILFSISSNPGQVLHLLESIGNRLDYLCCSEIFRNPNVHDIMRTCRNIVKLDLFCDFEDNIFQNNSNNLHQDQLKYTSKLPVLNYLTEINLHGMRKGLCSADMLIALLQSPWLNIITLGNVEVMSDDVMFNVLSSDCCTALSKVTEFTVMQCPLITAEPFIHWLPRENCSLQYMNIKKCEKVYYYSLRAAAMKCTKALVIEVSFD